MTEKYNKIGEELKKEYFGIDNQIDDILRAFETWETTKDFINKPLILSVVGTTGNGKSSVINKIVKKLELEDKKVYLKFNNRTTDIVKELKECKDSGMVVIMDEFQYLRTINEHGEEIKADKGDGFSILFDLFDDGNIILQNSDTNYHVRGHSMVYSLQEFIKHGVTYSNGVFHHDHLFDILAGLKSNIEPNKSIIKVKKLFDAGFFSGNQNIDFTTLYDEISKELPYDDEEYPMDLEEEDYDNEDEKAMQEHGGLDHSVKDYYSKTEQTLEFFLPTRMEEFFPWITDRCLINFENEHRLRDFLFNMKSIDELYTFLNNCFETKPRPTIKDFHNSLIITISNLDEAYSGLTSQVGADGDLDADYYNKESKKVTILKIRKALLKRFRAEQVARFGSRWVIYPILGKKNFKDIINKELVNFKDNAISKFNVNNEIATIGDVRFSQKIHDLIYAEGVFPTLGARCTFATVSEIVSEKFAYIVQTLIEFNNKYKSVDIEFDYNKKKTTIEVKYLNGSDVIKVDYFKYLVKIDNLRSESTKLAGRQAHRGCHEAGHAVASVILSKVVPEVVYSTLMESGDAITRFNTEDFYMPTIDNYINEVAVSLGGYAAEKMIFGIDKVSSGSSSDLNHATHSLSTLFKECGFGGRLGRFVSHQMPDNTMFRDGNYCLSDENNQFDKLIQEKINEAMLLVENTLLEQKVLLLKMTEYLIKQPKMTRKKIKELTKKYSVNFDIKELDSNKTKFYLDMINSELKSLKDVK